MEIIWLMELLTRQLNNPDATLEDKQSAITALQGLCEEIRRIRETWGGH